MERPTISVITVNYRQPEATMDLLRSICRQSFQDLEIILIDNAPQKDCRAEFEAISPKVQVRVNADNVGFAAANNQGMAMANGQYLFLLNNDTEVSEGFFRECLRPFEDDSVGAISPMICYYERPEIIQYAGFTAVDAWGRNRIIGHRETDLGQFTETCDTPYAHGAAMLLRREVWERVGNMPESFFLYYEELAWSVRIRRAGYRIQVHPIAKVLHKASLSTGRDSPLKTYYLHRNRLQFMWQCAEGPFRRQAFTLYYLMAAFPLHWFRLRRQGRIKHARALAQAVGDALFGRFGFRLIHS